MTIRFRVLLAVIALAAIACRGPRADVRPPDPLEVIPQNWIDLPDAPFTAKLVDGRAVLVNVSKSWFDGVSVGCVRLDDSRTRVLQNLFESTIHDGSWGPGGRVEGLLRMVNNIDYYIANQMKYIGKDILRRCPDESRIAVIHAVSVDGGTWSADGSAWKAKNAQ